jgi:hypothetical protein
MSQAFSCCLDIASCRDLRGSRAMVEVINKEEIDNVARFREERKTWKDAPEKFPENGAKRGL